MEPAARFYGYISFRETLLLKLLYAPKTKASKMPRKSIQEETSTDLLRASWMEIESIQFVFSWVFRICSLSRLLNSLTESGLVITSRRWCWSDPFACIPSLLVSDALKSCTVGCRKVLDASWFSTFETCYFEAWGCFLLLCLLSLGMRKIG